MVAAIVAEFDRTGELANTYLVFTSDNGYSLGARRLTQKMVSYEESVRVPLVIAGPDISPGSTDSMATTILGWAGVPVASDVDGVSLAGPLAGGAGLRSDFIAEYGGPDATGCSRRWSRPRSHRT